jgi:hypothetical protein
MSLEKSLGVAQQDRTHQNNKGYEIVCVHKRFIKYKTLALK